MGLRRYMVDAVVLEGRKPSELARAYGISQSWMYELVDRFDSRRLSFALYPVALPGLTIRAGFGGPTLRPRNMIRDQRGISVTTLNSKAGRGPGL